MSHQVPIGAPTPTWDGRHDTLEAQCGEFGQGTVATLMITVRVPLSQMCLNPPPCSPIAQSRAGLLPSGPSQGLQLLPGGPEGGGAWGAPWYHPSCGLQS